MCLHWCGYPGICQPTCFRLWLMGRSRRRDRWRRCMRCICISWSIYCINAQVSEQQRNHIDSRRSFCCTSVADAPVWERLSVVEHCVYVVIISGTYRTMPLILLRLARLRRRGRCYHCMLLSNIRSCSQRYFQETQKQRDVCTIHGDIYGAWSAYWIVCNDILSLFTRLTLCLGTYQTTSSLLLSPMSSIHWYRWHHCLFHCCIAFEVVIR